MKSKTILGADGATKMRQITVGIHGKGGEAGIKAIQQLAGMVDSLKQCQTPQEVYDRYLQITGYCKCCVDCNFIDAKGADELMCLAAYLAGNEQERAEAQQKAGKKAYVERVTKAGNTIEIERYFTSRYKKKGISRGDKVKPTKEEQEKVNTRQAERKLRILINASAGIAARI